MDFRFTDEEEAFRQEVREFLAREVSQEIRQEALESAGLGLGVHCRAFLRKLGERGWLGIDWPPEYGGQGRSIVYCFILYEELGYARGPWAGVGATIAGPTLLHLGNPKQKQDYLPRIARGEIEFTLGYTEPHAGSDLAALEIRAVEQDSHYVMNGHKIFNTTGHYGDYHWLGARTDPAAPRHRGISLFIVDLRSPGITISPIWTMAGFRTNAVYYDHVRVPKENLVGEKNKGFYHIMEALDWERIYATGDLRHTLEELAGYIQQAGAPGCLRQRLAELAVEAEVARLLALRVLWLLGKRVAPPSEASMCKVFGDELRQRLSRAGMEVLGLYGQLRQGSPHARLHGDMELLCRATVFSTISAGTSEVMRNIVAMRGLGLPRE